MLPQRNEAVIMLVAVLTTPGQGDRYTGFYIMGPEADAAEYTYENHGRATGIPYNGYHQPRT